MVAEAIPQASRHGAAGARLLVRGKKVPKADCASNRALSCCDDERVIPQHREKGESEAGVQIVPGWL